MRPLNAFPQLKCFFMNQHVAKRTKGLSDFLWLCFLYAPLKQTRPRFITSSNLYSAALFLCKILCPRLFLHLSAFKRDGVLLTHPPVLWPPCNARRCPVFFSHLANPTFDSALTLFVWKTNRQQYTVSARTMQTNFFSLQTCQKQIPLSFGGLSFWFQGQSQI